MCQVKKHMQCVIRCNNKNIAVNCDICMQNDIFQVCSEIRNTFNTLKWLVSEGIGSCFVETKGKGNDLPNLKQL